MRFKKTLICVLSALSFSPAFSQSDDFGIWTSLGAEKKLVNNLSVEAGFEFRSADNLDVVSRWGGSLGLNYKVAKFLKLSAGYAYLYDQNPLESKVNYNKKGEINGYNVDQAYWQSKHRAYFDVTGSKKVGRFKFSLRERYQYTRFVETECDRDRYRDERLPGYGGDIFVWNGQEFMSCESVVNTKQAKDKHIFRTRAKIEYNIPKCPLNPYISYELSNDLSDQLDLDKTRLIVGTEWKLTKKHIFTIGYLYQHGTDGEHEGGRHVLDLGYKFNF